VGVTLLFMKRRVTRHQLMKQRGATLVESLIAIVICGIIVGGLLTALKTAVRSSRTSSTQANIEGALSDAAQRLDRAGYIRCPGTDPARTYQVVLEEAAAKAGTGISRITLESVDYWRPGDQDWSAGPTLPPSTVPVTVEPTSTNPIVSTVVPTVSTLALPPVSVDPPATDPPPPPVGTQPVDPAISEPPTATVPTDSIPPTPTAPPVTDPPTLGFTDSDLEAISAAMNHLGLDNPLIGQTSSGLIRQTVDCAGASATSGTGPVQRIRIRAVTKDGVAKELTVVKSDD
jgi:type II secretory pathway pseudopilin PulG